MSLDFDPDGPAASEGLFGLPHSPDSARVRILPVPFDATTSYRQGTADAPVAILHASHQVDLCDLQTGEPWRHGIAMDPVPGPLTELNRLARASADQARSAQVGSPEQLCALNAVNQASAEVNSHVQRWTERTLDRHQIPAILGGDHAVPLGAMIAAAERYPELGILHIDAHADLRVAYEGFTFSHASIFHNVLQATSVRRLVQVGVRDLGHSEKSRIESDDRITCWSDFDVHDRTASGQPLTSTFAEIIAPLPQAIWISFDIDGLDPALCPHTGTPVPGGLTWREATALLAAVGRSKRQIVGFDLCEVASQEWDANVGARLLYKLAGWAIASQHRSET
ncbi:MAG: agmatinase family protein [Myxococcota bacterium]